jgi:hypothetical protein
MFFSGGWSAQMCASNSLSTELISSPIIGARQEQAVQATTLPLSIIFHSFARFIAVSPKISVAAACGGCAYGNDS